MKIVYFGTPQFSADVLRYLLDKRVDIRAVVTREDKPRGRSKVPQPSAVKEVAQEKNLPLLQPSKISATSDATELEKYEADLFVVVAYGEILRQNVLDMPKRGCINLHTSLLPKYRGAAPIQRALMAGEKESGVSIMYMSRKMDAGDVIRQDRVPIGPDESYGDLEKKLCSKGAKSLYEVICLLEKGPVQADTQEDAEVTFAPKIELEECEIDWNLPAAQIHNLVRGVNPAPGAWCWVISEERKLRLKIFETKILQQTGKPGEIFSTGNKGIAVYAGEGAVLLEIVQLEGKKRMPAEALFRGISLKLFTDN